MLPPLFGPMSAVRAQGEGRGQGDRSRVLQLAADLAVQKAKLAQDALRAQSKAASDSARMESSLKALTEKEQELMRLAPPAPAQPGRPGRTEAGIAGALAGLVSLFGNDADRAMAPRALADYFGARRAMEDEDAERRTLASMAGHASQRAGLSADVLGLQRQAAMDQSVYESAAAGAAKAQSEIDAIEKTIMDALMRSAEAEDKSVRDARADAAKFHRDTAVIDYRINAEQAQKSAAETARQAEQAALLDRAVQAGQIKKGSPEHVRALSAIKGGKTLAEAWAQEEELEGTAQRIGISKGQLAVSREQLRLAQEREKRIAATKAAGMDAARLGSEVGALDRIVRAQRAQAGALRKRFDDSIAGVPPVLRLAALAEWIKSEEGQQYARLVEGIAKNTAKLSGLADTLGHGLVDEESTGLTPEEQDAADILGVGLGKGFGPAVNPKAPPGKAPARKGPLPSRREVAPLAGDLAAQAELYVGVPYVWGGGRTQACKGVDCSGLLQDIDSKSGGIYGLRGTADSMYKGRVDKIDKSDARRGDLVFFDWGGDGKVDHVGVYLGNGMMIDAQGARDPKKWRQVAPRKVPSSAKYARPRVKVQAGGKPAYVSMDIAKEMGALDG